jgi:poly-gamma-glutamate synthesis protein (capsule biosynthesis protein)
LADWATTALAAFESDWEWHISASDGPMGALSEGLVQVALAEGAAGQLIHQEAIALAVPFTTNWEEVTLEQAQNILVNGQQIVTVLNWGEMTPDKRALRVNGRHPSDRDYPLQRTWSLVAGEGMNTAVNQLAPYLAEAWPRTAVVQMAAGGDIMLDRSLGNVLSQGGIEYPFAKVAVPLQTADITVGNMESALGDVGEPVAKSYPFQAPPIAAQALAWAGFDVVSLANNHGMDYGPESLRQGLDLLRAAGVEPIGAGLNVGEARTAVIREVNGLRLAFLGYVHVPVEASSNFDTESWTATADMPGLAWARPEWIVEDITAVRAQADLVIVVLHSGYEYIEPPSPIQMELSQAAINAGADLVIGHHAHVLQGIQFYNGGVIVYGLGNFAFEIDGDPSTAILNVWLDDNGVRELQIIPAIIQFGGQPRLAESWEAPAILQTVYRLTNSLNPR